MENSTLNHEKSTSKAPVFKFEFDKVKKVPDSDNLGYFNIPETEFTYVLNLKDWAEKPKELLVCWIQPDTLVNVQKPQFSFLAAEAKYDSDSNKNPAGIYYNVKARKLRGMVSYGLLVDAPEGLKDGDDGVEALGLFHYEPPVEGNVTIINGQKFSLGGGEVESPPEGIWPKYDIDNFLAYARLFVKDEPIYITSKIHGTNSCFVFKNEQQYCRSRTEFKREFATPPEITLQELIDKIGDEVRAKEVYDIRVTNFKAKRNLYWCAFNSEPSLKNFCEAMPGYSVWGEVYGQVQKGYLYDAKPGELKFRAFDVMSPGGRWLDFDEMKKLLSSFYVPIVPILAENIPYNFEEVKRFIDVPDPLGAKISEGIVVAPMKERYDSRYGRIKMKLKNPKFLEKNS